MIVRGGKRVEALAGELAKAGRRVTVMAPAKSIPLYTNGQLLLEPMGPGPETPVTIAANLYGLLEKWISSVLMILLAGDEEKGLDLTIMNRLLLKAAGGRDRVIIHIAKA